METMALCTFQLHAQLGWICGRIYFLQAFVAGKHLEKLAAFTFNFTSLFNTTCIYFSSLLVTINIIEFQFLFLLFL